MPSLRIPAVLAFTVIGAAASATGCGRGGTPTFDATACSVLCLPESSGSNNCPTPTCATGPNFDVCPAGCVPEPIA